jgi:hypothetical protein
MPKQVEGKPELMKNRNTIFTTIVIACFGLFPKTEAVVPAPDGGYGPPSYGQGNTAEGQDALFSLTNNGYWNTALGFEALYHDTSGSVNTATGVRALFSNTGGTYNAAYGYAALYDNTTGSFNTAYGSVALANNVDGVRNTAIGWGALYNNGQSYNTGVGYGALYKNDVGPGNTAIGYAALYNNEFGDGNTATGYVALYSNTAGWGNTANGYQALFNNVYGPENTAVGRDALRRNTTGGGNTAIGANALLNCSTGDGNVALGRSAGFNVTTASNVICIGRGVGGANTSNSCYISNIFGKTSSGGAAVLVNSAGKLGTITSARRFKDEIKPMGGASEALFALRPVTFRYKKDIDPRGTSQFGLVAEEVEKVSPDLVVRDEDGKAYSVRYEQVNAMLLNEFLKEHRKNEEQTETIADLKLAMAQEREDFEAKNAQQQRQIDALTAGLQKVSAQIEVSKPAPKIVLNNP